VLDIDHRRPGVTKSRSRIMPRFYGRLRRFALLPAVEEVQRQRNDDDEGNDGGDGEPDASEREQRRPWGVGALGLGGEVVRRSFGTRGMIARRLVIPRRISHDQRDRR
jgi:hypothetical protein